MTITVVYCNTCSPKAVLGTGQVDLPARHWVDSAEHTDCGKAEIDITRNGGESANDFHIRIETNNQDDMT